MVKVTERSVINLSLLEKTRFAIVRCAVEGLWFGEIFSIEDSVVALSNARRIYYWEVDKGHTISALAIHGCSSKSKFAEPVEFQIFLQASGVTYCSEKSIQSLLSQGWGSKIKTPQSQPKGKTK